MMNRYLLSAVLSLATPLLSHGETLAIYLNGTQSLGASEVALGLMVTDLTASEGEWRTAYGNPGSTPAGPNLGTTRGSYWRLVTGAATPSTATSGDASFSATITAESILQTFLVDTLSFDLAIAIHNAAASSVTTGFTLFINGTALNSSFISPGTSLFSDSNNTYKVQTFSADLSSLGAFSSLEFEIALEDDYTGASTVGNFVQGIKVEGSVIPEPGSALLLLTGLPLAMMRRRGSR